MKLLVVLAAVCGLGWYYLGGDLSGRYPGVFLADGSPGVSLVTSDQCGAPCESARQHLLSRNIAFSEVNASQDRDGWQSLGRPNTVPFLIAGNYQASGFNPGFFSAALASALGAEGLSAQEQRIYSQHFSVDGEPKIVLYGVEWCGYCNRLRKRLDNDGISYDYRDMEKPVKQKWLMDAMGIHGYPVVYIGYERVLSPDYDGVMKTLKRQAGFF